MFDLLLFQQQIIGKNQERRRCDYAAVEISVATVDSFPMGADASISTTADIYLSVAKRGADISMTYKPCFYWLGGVFPIIESINLAAITTYLAEQVAKGRVFHL